MKKRIGSDVKGVKWTINAGGEPFNWADALNLTIVAKQAKRPENSVTPAQMQLDGNVLEVFFSGSDLELGKYILVADFSVSDVTAPAGKIKTPIDWINAFEIVEHTYQEDEEGAEFTSDLKFGVNGLNAYEAYVKYCELNELDAVSESEYLLGPAAAYQAAQAAITAANNANAAADLAVEKAGLANIAAGNANSAADLATEKAGLAQEAADNANEKATLADEKAGLADTAAGNANDAAALADSKATLANDAAEAATTAKENADTATINAIEAAELANTKASLADSKATLANDAATTANDAADNADGKATLANNAADSANTATSNLNAALNSQIVEVQVTIIDNNTYLATGDWQGDLLITEQLNGFSLIGVVAKIGTASTLNKPMFNIRKNTTDVLSTALTIDANATNSLNASVPAIILVAERLVATGDLLKIDVDAIGTGTKGGGVIFLFQKLS